ncbi:MAG: DUF975 family protein [Clostridiales bacterium]|nr:DUF975 family protein [Clostridiales bacterium]
MRIDSKTRKSLKSAAKASLKKHYVMFVFMCLFASLIGAEFVTSDNFIAARTDAIGTVVSGYEEDILETEQKAASFTGTSAYLEKTNELIRLIKFQDARRDEVFSRSAGTINHILDYLTSGTIVSTISSVVLNIVGSESAADIVMIALSVLVAVWFWMFVQLVYSSTIRRIALEGRLYKNIPFSRFVFFIRIKSWINAALVMALHAVCDIAALITVVGFPIVFYGLFMVPFILAENPKIKPAAAIRLSWSMTKGHRWDLFVNDVTLFGWYVLGVITAGLTNILFGNPYRIAVYSELYALLRKEAIDNRLPGSEAFSDRYLFEKCDMARLRGAYPEAVNVLFSPEYELKDLHGAKRFFADHFGVVLWNTKDEKKYEENQASRQRIMFLKAEAEGTSYPTRLGTVPESGKIKILGSIHYMRHYSLLSLIMMFFIYSGFGWVWEVVYYYMLQGHYINRGVLHGPWLPIYGAGGLAILIFLFPLRKSPTKHFFATMLLCGALEYFTSVVLEYAFDAQWWSYEGFFLNINGRICAEGLLVFGIAGIAFIYFLSPVIDDQIRRIDPRKLLPIAVVLLAFFTFDLLYSNSHPNKGDGITDGFAGGENTVSEQTYEESVN